MGSNLAVGAIDRGHHLVVLDNLSRQGSAENLQWLRGKGEFRFVHADIRDSNSIDRIIADEKPGVVFHLAGQVAMTRSIENPRFDFEVNVGGTINILEAVRNCRPEAIVLYSSTNKVYGDLDQYAYEESPTRYTCKEYPAGFDEKVPLDFHSPYGCSKGAADQYVLDYGRVFGLRTAVFRHSSMYGGRQFATYDQGWIGWFCRQALDAKAGRLKEPFTISGSGKQVRDVLHAEDVKRLYFGAAEHIDRVKGEAFNIGGGMKNSLSLLELFHILEKEVGVALAYNELPWRKSDQRVFVANVEKIGSRLDWEPEIDKECGIRQMLAWLSEDML